MPDVLVLSTHAARYREILESGDPPETRWPAVKFHYAASLAEAQTHAAHAAVLFGAPDMVAELLPHCPRLRWVQSSWAGITPLLEQARRDYSLTGVKDIFGAPMAEYVLGWLLALERRIPAHFSARHWDPRREGYLHGKRVGIMGTGSIGSHVARACRSMGMQTRGMNSDGREVEGFERCWPGDKRLEFADGLDYLVALLPATPATDGLVDAELLAQLGPGAILVNGGRGNSVVTDDVVAALASGKLRHAVLDVLPVEPLPDTDPLWQVEGLTITSHTAAPTPARAIVGIFTDNLDRFLAGEPLQYLVDFERGY